MIKVGINGFGRIGRAIFRIIQSNNDLEVVAINDLDSLIDNHVYLANYDTIYGKLEKKLFVNKSNNSIINRKKEINFYSQENINDVKWNESGADIIFDSSGILNNVKNSHKLIDKCVKKIIVTHSPSKYIDQTLILAANEENYKKENNVISSSICDANACAPALKALDNEFGIKDGFITTLHPWLGYQNLTDGSLKSVSSPGHYWKDFALGRASLDSLIPKKTTLMPAIRLALPEMNQEISAMSFRVPTAIVSASDITLTLNKNIQEKDVIEVFKTIEKKYPEVILLNEESLVSIDFKGIEQSCVIDLRWLQVFGGNKLKLIIWYDNEWGYSNRAVDIAELVLNKEK